MVAAAGSDPSVVTNPSELPVEPNSPRAAGTSDEGEQAALGAAGTLDGGVGTDVRPGTPTRPPFMPYQRNIGTPAEELQKSVDEYEKEMERMRRTTLRIAYDGTL